MENETERKLHILLSGFGPFGEVSKNPSQELLSQLSEKDKQQCGMEQATVLEVSMKGVEDYIIQMKELIKSMNDRDSKDHLENYVFIALGVKKDTDIWNLETACYNEASFRMPDQQNEQPQNQQIATERPFQERFNCPIDLQEFISKNDLQQFVSLSENPGRFLCNYIYYKLSITFPNSTVLFVHIPHFEKISLEQQYQQLIVFLKAIQDSRSEIKAAKKVTTDPVKE